MRIIIAICTACAVGLHFVLLQCVAWIGMAVVYTQQEQSLLGGLSKTFDGEHPCCLCEVVKAAQESEREQDLPAEPTHQKDVKLVQALVSGEFVLPQYPSGGFDRSPWKLGEPCTQGLAPLEQPPQVA